MTYNWTNSDQSVIEISHPIKDIILLTDIPDDAEALQISVENRLGSSLLSEPVKIICDYRGCNSTKTPFVEIFASIFGVLLVVLIVIIVFVYRRLILI